MEMTDKKILRLLDGYEVKLLEMRDGHPSEIEFFGYRSLIPNGGMKLKHVIEMIPKMRKFLGEGRREKEFRWLGFLQCVFWMLDIYTVEQLADHSRPSKADLQEQYPEHSFDESCGICSTTFCKYAREFAKAPESALPIT